jgi:hypothetical protein
MRAGLERETPLQSSRASAYQSRNSFKVLPMSDEHRDELPDRLSTDPKSPYHNAELLERGVGIRFNGVDRTNVEEYCVSEGWVRLAVGKTVDRHGNAMTVKYKGKVEPYLRAPE